MFKEHGNDSVIKGISKEWSTLARTREMAVSFKKMTWISSKREAVVLKISKLEWVYYIRYHQTRNPKMCIKDSKLTTYNLINISHVLGSLLILSFPFLYLFHRFGKVDIRIKRIILDLIPYTKVNWTLIKDFDVRPQIVNLLVENIGRETSWH